jgi:hypothetical protein
VTQRCTCLRRPDGRVYWGRGEVPIKGEHDPEPQRRPTRLSRPTAATSRAPRRTAADRVAADELGAHRLQSWWPTKPCREHEHQAVRRGRRYGCSTTRLCP